MKFRYYITTIEDGETFGTNNFEIAQRCLPEDGYSAIDVETGENIYRYVRTPIYDIEEDDNAPPPLLRVIGGSATSEGE